MKHLKKAVLTASTAMILATPAAAQEAGDIIVTARRVEERLQDVPISISVFSQDDLQRRNISNIGDLGTYTPSLSTNSRFGPEKSSFAIRGFTQEYKTSPSVGVYFADVVGLRANSSTAAGNGAGVGDLFDLQNVQVLKGPQGTLFGRNTTGGAVLLVPHKPVDRLEGYVEGSVGNYDMHRLQGVLNVPLADTLLVRAGVDWQERDGYQRNRSGIGPKTLADVNYIAARITILGQLTPNLENSTIATYSNSDTNGSTVRLQQCNQALAATPAGFLAALGCAQIARQAARGDGYYDVENGLPDPHLKVEQWRVINTTTWTASDHLTIKNIASYGEFRESNALSVFGDNFFLAPGVALPLINLNPGSSGFNSSQSTFTEELQLQGSTGDDRLTWVVGGYAEISRPIKAATQYVEQLINCSDVSQLKCTALLGDNSSIGAQWSKDYFDNFGIFAQGTYKLTDAFSITGGIRYTYDKMRTQAEHLLTRFPAPNTPAFYCQDLLTFDSNPSPNAYAPLAVTNRTQCDRTIRISSNRPTWAISAEYKATPDALVYAKWARGYRAGGINSLVYGLETWGPEKVDTYEIGAKTTFRGSVSGYFNLAAFYNDFTQQQLSANLVPSPNAAGVSAQQGIVNAGKSRIWGVEIDASIMPVEGLRFDLGYAYLNTKLVDINVAASSQIWAQILPNALEGGPLALSPRNRLSLTGSYTLPLSESIGKISFGATYVYTSEQNSTSAATSPLYRIRSTQLLNLNADWKGVLGSPIDASVFVTNATKQEFHVFSSGGYPFFGVEGVVPAPPRMYGLRLKYSFGS